MREFFSSARDWVFPMLDGPRPGNLSILKRAAHERPSWNARARKKLAAAWAQEVEKEFDAQDDRRKHLDSRLQAALGSVPVILAILALISNSEIKNFWPLSLVAVYAALQLMLAFFNAVNGLSLRGYYPKKHSAPQPDSRPVDYSYELARSWHLKAAYNSEQNNWKASHLKLVYACFTNAALGLAGLIIGSALSRLPFAIDFGICSQLANAWNAIQTVLYSVVCKCCVP